VVSSKAEALSHSDTDLKLVPSYDLFQILPESEGGGAPVVLLGNFNKGRTDLKGNTVDALEGYQIITGDSAITKLPNPFKMVERMLVSSDQPILSIATKHFFEKRHGKRFRPTIIQLVATARRSSARSLIHDDVLNEADTCWGGESVHKL